MSECEFCHPENYCENEGECKHRGDLRECKAKPKDLIDICEDCGNPVDECGCGINWILVKDKEGNIVPITPKVYTQLKKETNQ